jgi:predicted CopG family antitoxin
MHKTQIIIEDKHYEFLKAYSKKENKSISRILREIIDSFREKTGLFSLSSIAGIAEDTGLYGKDHDKSLYDK